MNRKIFQRARAGITILFLLTSFSVFPIGRVGDGKSVSSIDLGFDAVIPEFYTATRFLKDGTLNVYYPTFSPNEGFKEQFLLFHPIQTIYPTIIGSTKAESQNFLSDLGLSVQTKDSCIVAFRIESRNLIYTVFQWAPDKGIVVMGPLGKVASESLKYIESHFQLLPGACGWN